MVVKVIDQKYIMSFELEDHSPVAAHVHCPKADILAFQLMQSQTRKVHVSRFRNNVQPCEDQSQPIDMFRLYSCFVACLEEIFQAFVSEADNHVTNIDCNLVGGNIKKDRKRFLDSFSKLLVQTGTVCLAWSLMTN